MVGSAPVDDGRGGQSDHSGKRALSLVTVDHALLHFTQLPSSCGHVVKSDFFVDFFFIASSDAQTTKIVDASCGFGIAGVSGTGLQELSTSSSWCGVRMLSPWPSRLRWWVRPTSMTGGVGNPTTAAKQHSLQSAKLVFTMARSAKQRLCHNSANNHVCTLLRLARALRNRAGFQP